MSEENARRAIVLIDRQHSWLERSAQTLRRAGFDVETLDNYNYPDPDRPNDVRSRLVVLGCASVGPDELELIQRFVHHRDYLLVLSTAISSREMRNLFLHGATDVTDKPYDPGGLLETVTQVLESLSPQR